MSLVQYLLQHEPSFRESRLPSLYSDLTNLRNTNPEGFTANAQAWTSALIRLAVSGNLPTEQRIILSTSSTLLGALSSPTYGRPVGLGAVLDEAVRERKMIDLADFTKSEKSIYAKSWIPSPWSILSWSLRTAGLLGNSTYDKRGDLRPGNLVLIPVLEDLTKNITAWQQQQNLHSLTDRIFTREAFLAEISKLLPSQNVTSANAAAPPLLASKDLDVLLLYLSRDHPILSYNDTTIKLSPPSSSHPPTPITPEDTAIANLKSLINSLTQQTQSLETTITQQTSRAQHAVSQKQKSTALAALRSKKLAERTLEQRSATLQQLEEVFTQIENAAGQVDIVETLRNSATALKSLNGKVGSVESVDAVLEELREEMQKTGEVQGVLAEPLTDSAGVDAVELEEEVDEELEALERDERAKLQEARDAQEVKATEARLRELEGLRHEQNVADANAMNAGGDSKFQQQLSSSVEKMGGLSLSSAQEKDKENNEPATQRTTLPQEAV